MIPERFVAEYPARCLELLRMLEPKARQRQLLGSFTLLVASSMLIIPLERMNHRNPRYRENGDQDLSAKLVGLKQKHARFLNAEFWNGNDPGKWRFSRIKDHLNESSRWIDGDGRHPMDESARNSIGECNPYKVLHVIRNALAHGNVIYLNSGGREQANSRLRYLGFLSRYEETDEQKSKSTTYRLVATTDENFLQFIKAWATWIAGLKYDQTLSEAA